MSNMTMMNNAKEILLSIFFRCGVDDAIICASIACDVIIICGVIHLIAGICLFFSYIKDRTEDKECKKDEEVA